MSKKHSTRETTQKIDLEEIITEIFALFQSLFSMRLVDKISRPIDNSQRMDIVAEYKQKFTDLHHKLDSLKRISTNTYINNDTGASQKNQEKSTKAHKPFDFKNQIRKVESRYVDLFRDGSFKYYDKIAKLYGLPENLYLINIENWTNQTLGSNQGRTSCC